MGRIVRKKLGDLGFLLNIRNGEFEFGSKTVFRNLTIGKIAFRYVLKTNLVFMMNIQVGRNKSMTNSTFPIPGGPEIILIFAIKKGIQFAHQ